MKMCIGNEPFLDRDTDRPVEGRLTVYEHGTDVMARVYTLDGDGYAVAQNPCLLHGGYPDDSLFTDIGLVDLKVEKYIGVEGQLSTESPDEDFTQIDIYSAGLDYDPERATQNQVDDMDALRAADTSLGQVSVLWYSEPGDCVPRTYVWDELSQNQEDGGYVVHSDDSDTGRWILVWDDEALPCTVYGVTAGNESNMNLLLNYPEVVGSFRLRTAPCVRFVSGSYTSDVAFSTTKELWFDHGAKFLGATFECSRVRTFGEIDDYVADFVFDDGKQVAHSAWFRTALAFLNCGAEHLVLDGSNYFVDTVIPYATGVAYTLFEAHTQLPFTYQGNGSITFTGCDMVGSGFIGTSDKVIFRNMEFREDWMYGSVNSYDFLSNTIVRTAYGDTILLGNFENVTAYVKCIEADGQTDVDLAGRHVGTLTTSVLRTFRNVSCNTLNVTADGANVDFHNVRCQNVNISGWNLTVHDSVIKFWTEPTLNGLFCYDSDVASQYAVTGMSMACTFENCRVGMSFSRGSDNMTRDGALTFRECTFYNHESISSKNISMYGCVTDDAYIKVYPYHDGTNYRIFCRFVGNTFVGSTPIEFTKYNEDICFDCIADWTIVNNSFTGNDEGLRCRYWSNRTGSYFDKVFIMPDNRSSIVYSGNTGNCPAESMKGASMAAGATPIRTIDIGSGNNLYVYNAHERCCPKFVVSQTDTGTSKLYKVAAARNDTYGVAIDNSNNQNMRHFSGLYYWSYGDGWADRDGDFFQLGLCIWVTHIDSHWVIAVV